MHDIKLHDLKIPKKKRNSKPQTVYGEDDYPWQTRLDFSEDVVDKVPSLERLEVGDEVCIYARAKVVRKSETKQDEGEDNYSVVLQMTSLGVANANDYEEAFKEASGKKK